MLPGLWRHTLRNKMQNISAHILCLVNRLEFRMMLFIIFPLLSLRPMFCVKHWNLQCWATSCRQHSSLHPVVYNSVSGSVKINKIDENVLLGYGWNCYCCCIDHTERFVYIGEIRMLFPDIWGCFCCGLRTCSSTGSVRASYPLYAFPAVLLLGYIYWWDIEVRHNYCYIPLCTIAWCVIVRLFIFESLYLLSCCLSNK